jgi:glucose-1-phosphate thymidylyltransferase
MQRTPLPRKGILLAGGAGTRLHPVTRVVSKQLLPVYDKPMVYYSLSVLMLSGIREVLVISTPTDLPRFAELLGDGSDWGMALSYCEQPSPDGIAQSFLLGRQFLGGAPSALILGDNLFYGNELVSVMKAADARQHGATVFAYHVTDPERYGVVEFDAQRRVLSIEEKPTEPRSRYAITGLYFYDDRVTEIAAGLKTSARGELEITDINRAYLEAGALQVEILGRGMAWLDTGTHESLLQAATFIETIETRQGLKVGCPEEIAFRNGWIDAARLEVLAASLGRSRYADYLRAMLHEEPLPGTRP